MVVAANEQGVIRIMVKKLNIIKSLKNRGSKEELTDFELRRQELHARQAANGTRETADHTPMIVRAADAWWNRLIGAVFSGKVSEETERYASHRTKRDYIFNTIGSSAWGMLFPILTIVSTQLVGAEEAGMFSMAMVVGQLLLFVANFGARTYQVSDVDEMQSFLDYQIHRLITCAFMLVAGLIYIRIRGYTEPMSSICTGVFLFRLIDGLADVYEGRLQQKDKLYLAGISQAVRCGAAIVGFSVVLLLTHNLPFACFAMAIGAVASFILLTLPVTFFETDRSLPWSTGGIKELFINCLPLFLALFLYNLVDSVPKFAIEGALSYDNQLYYNALYFPAHAILMAVGLVYKPQLVRLANIWADPEQHRRFDIIVLVMLGIIAGVTLVVALIMNWIGIPLMSILYGVNFERFRSLATIMVITGGICAVLDFLYQIITVLREQGRVTRIYLIGFAFAVPISILLVNYAKLAGAVMASLVSMSILLVLLATEYISIRNRDTV